MSDYQLRLKIGSQRFEVSESYGRLATARRKQKLIQAELKEGSRLLVEVTGWNNYKRRVVKED